MGARDQSGTGDTFGRHTGAVEAGRYCYPGRISHHYSNIPHHLIEWEVRISLPIRNSEPHDYIAVHCPFLAALRGTADFDRIVARAAKRVAEFRA